MADIKIYKDIVVKSMNEIKPYWRNPRKNDKTVDALCKVIPEVGFNVPLVIDEKGIIVKGHARYRAAVLLGLKELPCIITDQSEEKNRLDRLSDNKISELTEWDIPELRYELEQIEFPLEDVGFDVPKTEFMTDVYAQKENNEVDQDALNKAKQDIISHIHSLSGSKIDTSDWEEDNQAEENKEETPKVLKIRCPNCNEEIIVPYV